MVIIPVKEDFLIHLINNYVRDVIGHKLYASWLSLLFNTFSSKTDYNSCSNDKLHFCDSINKIILVGGSQGKKLFFKKLIQV